MDEPIWTLRRENGVWVVYTGEPLSADTVGEMMREIRVERDLAHFG